MGFRRSSRKNRIPGKNGEGTLGFWILGFVSTPTLVGWYGKQRETYRVQCLLLRDPILDACSKALVFGFEIVPKITTWCSGETHRK